MSRHLPTCPYAHPCPDEWRNTDLIAREGLPIPHRIVSGSSGRCVECDAGDCICFELREASEAMRAACIAAVEALPLPMMPSRIAEYVIAALREVEA